MATIDFTSTRRTLQWVYSRRSHKRMPRISSRAWEGQKSTIYSLYVGQKMYLHQVRRALKDRGFACSHRQLVVQLRKWDMKKFLGHATNTGGRIAPTVPHAQGDDPDDTNLFQSYLQRKTVSMAQVSGSNASTFLENSTATSSYIDMQSPFSQQHTPSIFGTELSMDMHEDTDALLVRSLWDESLDVATLDGSAGLSQNDVFYDDFGIDVPGAIGLVGGSEIDVSRELLSRFSGCRSCCDGSCMDK